MIENQRTEPEKTTNKASQRRCPHNLPLTNAAGDVEQPIPSTFAESE